MRRCFIIGWGLFVVGFFALQQPWAGDKPHNQKRGQLVQAQSARAQRASARDYVRQSLAAHQNSSNYQAWQQHPLHPSRGLQNFEASIMCQVMAQLNPVDLNVFYKELKIQAQDFAQTQNSMQLQASCWGPILKRHQSYIQATRVRLKKRALKKIHRAPGFQNLPRNLQLGPSQAIVLDPAETPFVVAHALQAKQIVFSFDDGPHPHFTSQLLSDLREHGVVAHFFVVGAPALRHPEVLHLIQSDGHIVGTHSQSHAVLTRLSAAEAQAEICEGFRSSLRGFDNSRSGSPSLEKASLERASLKRASWEAQLPLEVLAPFFRFPYGAFNESLKNFVRQNHLANFFWRIDTLDWKYKNPKQLLTYTLQQIEHAQKGVVLMHDIQPQSLAIMPSLLFELAVRGYKSFFYQPTHWVQSMNNLRACR